MFLVLVAFPIITSALHPPSLKKDGFGRKEKCQAFQDSYRRIISD